MKFTKMHGCGNDYVYVNTILQKIDDRNAFAKKVSDRHFGVGADGLICIDSSDVADFKMDMYNCDGSRGKMCGNGIRCVGKFVYEYGLTDKTTVTVETLGGIKILYLHVKDHVVESVKVCMGEPGFHAADIPVSIESDTVLGYCLEIDGIQWVVSCVSMGNPHAVIFVEDTESLDLGKIGPLIEQHPMFPERTKVEFVQIVNRDCLKMRVWERGSGETLACGTGTCAALVISALFGYTNSKANVHVRGSFSPPSLI